ncbi:MAG: TIGR01777 family oxidoreductase [Opitutaceae bacterium]|jgi:hypothetical protein
MRIIVAGASGFVGSALVPALRALGHDVVVLVRRPVHGDREVFWDPATGKLDCAKLGGVDAVVNLAGAGIADARWTRERKALLRSSRVKSTETLVKAIGSASPRPRVLVNASAIGYYGNRGSEILTELSAPGEGFLANLCGDWERAAYAASPLGVRVVCLRCGVVLSSRGGVLARMKPLFRLGLGGRFGDGRAWMSWIASADLVRLIAAAIEDERYEGSINAVAPWPVTNADFTAMVAAALRRSAVLAVPGWVLKAAFGSMAEEMLLSSARALPAKLGNLKFEYSAREIPEALMDNL